MVTDCDILNTAQANRPHTYYGLSTDEKPETANNGSRFIEMDTGNVFLFDAEGVEWLEVGAS